MPVVSRGIWILVFLWMAGILYTSSLGQAITPVGGVLQTLVAKLGHVVEYAILGALLLWALLREVGGGASPWKAVILTAFLGMLFASVDELRQSFSPGREPRVTDVFIDLASMLGGSVIVVKFLLAPPNPPDGIREHSAETVTQAPESRET